MARTKLVSATSTTGDETKAKKQARVLKALEKDAKKSNVGSGTAAGIKKAHRWRRGTVARRQCKQYQSGRTPDGTRTLIPKTSLGRRIRDKAAEYSDDVRFQGQSLEAMQSSTEALIIDMLTDAARLTAMRGRKTVTCGDFLFVVSMYFRDYEGHAEQRRREAESARQRRERAADI